VAPNGQRQQGSPAEARGGGDQTPSGGAQATNGTQGNGGRGGNGGGFGNGGGRGGFDPNMTPEERRKRMEERMAAMTPEERAAFQDRMAQRAAQGGGRGGFGGGQGQGGNGQNQGGGQQANGQGNAMRQNGNQNAATPGAANQSGTGQGPTRMSRIGNTPAVSTNATTIDSLFGPLPTVESRGQAWLYENKQLKQVRLRLGVSDGTNIEVIDGPPEVKEGADVVTNVIIDQPATANQNNANNPLLGPQRGRPGGPGGGPGGGGGGGGRGGGR